MDFPNLNFFSAQISLNLAKKARTWNKVRKNWAELGTKKPEFEFSEIRTSKKRPNIEN